MLAAARKALHLELQRPELAAIAAEGLATYDQAVQAAYIDAEPRPPESPHDHATRAAREAVGAFTHQMLLRGWDRNQAVQQEAAAAMHGTPEEALLEGDRAQAAAIQARERAFDEIRKTAQAEVLAAEDAWDAARQRLEREGRAAIEAANDARREAIAAANRAYERAVNTPEGETLAGATKARDAAYITIVRTSSTIHEEDDTVALARAREDRKRCGVTP